MGQVELFGVPVRIHCNSIGTYNCVVLFCIVSDEIRLVIAYYLENLVRLIYSTCRIDEGVC